MYNDRVASVLMCVSECITLLVQCIGIVKPYVLYGISLYVCMIAYHLVWYASNVGPTLDLVLMMCHSVLCVRSWR